MQGYEGYLQFETSKEKVDPHLVSEDSSFILQGEMGRYKVIIIGGINHQDDYVNWIGDSKEAKLNSFDDSIA